MAAALGLDVVDRAAVIDVIDDLRALEFPRIAERQPLFRQFLLPAVDKDLAKQAVVMLSIKQAASRPSPPLPSAASGSARRMRSGSTPRSPSAIRTSSVMRRFSTTSLSSRPSRNSSDR